MIYVYLKGHDFEYDVRELIKVFFFNEDIVFIHNEEEYMGNNILLKNVLTYNKYGISSTTMIYMDNKLLSKNSITNIQDIKIEKDDLKKKIKVGIKQNIYNSLIEISETSAPWGILTGIRPVKIVHTLLDKGLDEEEIFSILNNQYKLFKDKAKLIIDICKRQRKYIYPLDENRFSLYVSIPFCPTRCLYCSFPTCSVSKYDDFVDEYTDRLVYEINQISDIMKEKPFLRYTLVAGPYCYSYEESR